ncbi:hypothetical protein P700755_000628 [Psychroflexus torquis ATCC 700755]|uniref:Uncharacterized protein n=1 Tax=Psychroflexus torquis (strain ATCC 700755 / CIP 106069 / ACAM 623) TaxID=313595 RepID=K4ICP9_PSYTT|nr:hypothetical protein [Psychroflexus torquis]AFU67648.1 hypothetical protein P700755_000628 [Psychroflexus torquis ATCC 700755]
MIVTLFIFRTGIGLKLGTSEMKTTLFNLVGLALSVIGLLILVRANKKTDQKAFIDLNT